MSGIKCISSIIRSTSRIGKQVQPGVCKGFLTDIAHSQRKLCTLTALNWNTDVLNTKVAKKSTLKFSYNSPIALGCLSMVQPLLIETSDSSGDMLDCLVGDEDSDTWSYI